MVAGEPASGRADASSDDTFRLRPPQVALPKGGGAIRGMGEKFAANPVTGTGSLTLPVVTSPGRSGFGPTLALSYDSAAGNGPFGFGWTLSLASIARKTDKGLPRYNDSEESDVFILSGAEDLVPVYRQDADGSWTAARPGYQRDPLEFWVRNASGQLVVHEDELDGYRVRRYRPRIEGLFARIERWSSIADASDVHWRSFSQDNVLTVYGLDASSRIADPAAASRIFSWLICETRDDRGNAVLYRYKSEDGVGAPLDRAHERNRGPQDDARRTANRYPKRILYGNRIPLLNGEGRRPRFLTTPQIDAANWMFEVVLDYGDHDPATPAPRDDTARTAAGVLRYPWPHRSDAFSSYRSCFEIRTARRCKRVLMFHHFSGVVGVERDCLVRSTDFTYTQDVDPTDARNPVYSFLTSVRQWGYRRNAGGYERRSFPAVELGYTQPIVHDTIEHVDQESLANLPIGLDGSSYRWTDLHGEGIPGLLTEQAGAWYYKRNLSPLAAGLLDGSEQVKARFAAMEPVALRPNLAVTGGAQFADLAGDGLQDLVVMDGDAAGLYEHDDAEGWLPFRSFAAPLNRSFRDPNLRLVDLDGDGQPDVLVTEDDAFVWHASLAEQGFGPARRVAQALDEERGPRVLFADGTQSIQLADLSGDGLTDIVRIRNGEVCYWPNLGHGRFGAKVTMDNAPRLDQPEQFDPRRVRLADIDGSGTTDIIYLHRDGVRLYFNQAGNSWSRPTALAAFPRIDDVTAIEPVDLLGNGTACLVWSSPLPAEARRPMRYVNLMGPRKPHLLVTVRNNLGAETRVDYAPSTRFYLQDKRDGNPWITRLPIPVHVVERIELYDHVSRNRFVTRHAYHHGYFDGAEREFRGFGMVEQWDTEQFATLAGGNLPADNIATASHVPAVRTKTWFHTGAYLGRERVTRQFEQEYFRERGLDVSAARPLLVDDTPLPQQLTVEEEREVCRALKGMMLRREVYADDADHPAASPAQIERARVPYTVTEQNFTIKALQRRGGNPHGVFFVHAREEVNYRYERNPVDPRVQHVLTLEVDAFGNVLKRVDIAYGRRAQVRVVDAQGQVQQVPNPGLNALAHADQAKQTTPLLTYTENRFTNAIESADSYRAPISCDARTFELTGYTPSGPAGRYRAEDFVEPEPADGRRLRHLFTAPDVPYEDTATGNRRRRTVQWLRTLYRGDDLSDLLPLGDLQSLALPGETYQLAFTPGLLSRIFQRPRVGQPAEVLLPDPAAVLSGQSGSRGGYLQSQTLKADGRFPASDLDDHWWVPSGQAFFSSGVADTPAAELAQARQHFFQPRRYRDPFGHTSFVDFDSDDLLIVETRDPLGNRVTVEANDYRVLEARLTSDANRNRTEVAFDVLGMVVGTAVMGKAAPEAVQGDTLSGFVADLTPAQLDAFMLAPRQPTGDLRVSEATQIVHDLLQGATTRIVYDLDRFARLGEPPLAATIARETHVGDVPPGQRSRLRISFSYSDGFGREIQTKIQAEPGRLAAAGAIVSPRWVGSGWTIFNNKGKPVRNYEPFFSDTHRFEFGVAAGVSPVLFYDAAGRLIATLHPNRTFEKVVFDPWRELSYDVNDTCAPRNRQSGDPRTDPDIGGYVAEYFKTQPANWETWRALRMDAGLGPDERNAALQAQAHADTPTIQHLDALGRKCLTISHNRTVCAGHDLHGAEDSLATRFDLDIEGHQRVVRDERRLPVNHVPTGALEQRSVMRYDYDLLGHRIHQFSMEAGARWTLIDVTDKPLRAWDSRGHNFIMSYDALRRPVEQYVRGTNADSDPRTLNRDSLVDRIEYGEPPLNATGAQETLARRLNLRTQIYRHFDCAGVSTNARLDANGNPIEAYDFKGNLLRSTRTLLSDYVSLPDWLLDPALGNERFESGTRYDAMNRAIQSIAPYSSATRAQRPDKVNVLQHVFNEANLLERVDVWLERSAEPAALLDPAADPPSSVGVADIGYDAKGQRARIDLRTPGGRVIRTSYAYDRETFRLTHLYTRRGVDPASDQGVAFTDDCENPAQPAATMAAPEPPPRNRPCGLQNLHYTYDPVGNITRIRDDAQQTLYFRNQRIEPSVAYVYDAVYRLIQAEGREHLGQQGNGARNAPTAPDAFNAFHIRKEQPNVLQAMGTYVERYVYDAVGNILQTQHRGSDPAHAGWTRAYDYLEASLIEDGNAAPLRSSNRLSRTTLDPNGAHPSQVDAYQHDAHGNVARMPHLGGGLPGANMHWDYKDRLRQTDLGGGGAAFYVYDASGQRVRKVWEKSPGLVEERIYIGGFEIFRRHSGSFSAPLGAGTATLERETLHIMDDKQRIAVVEARTLDTAGNDPAPRQLIRYQLGNLVGSATLELDERAQIISYEEYTPYGSSTYQAVRSQTETPKRYRYTGKERDDETGLYYHGARYYAAWLGRWSAPDPLFLHDSNDLYVYALDNPLVAKDPTGGPVWLIPVAIYLGWRALESAAETGVEAGIAEATDDESFSVGKTFVKNMAVNSVIGLIPGAAEAKIGTKVAIYGAKLAVRTGGDATLDTVQGKGTFEENLQKNALANVGGDVAGTLLKKGGKHVFDKLKGAAEEGTQQVSEKLAKGAAEEVADATQKSGEVLTEKGTKELAQKVPEAAAEGAVKKVTATTPSEVFALLSKFRDEEVEMVKRLYPELVAKGKPDPTLNLRGANTGTWFGNILNERVRRRVEAAVADGTLTNQLRWTRQGQKGVDFWLPDGTGFDLFTAFERELLKHEDKILNKLAPDGQTTINNLLPLLYQR